MLGFSILVSFLWGIGQNLPYEQLCFHGIGLGDFLFLGWPLYLFLVVCFISMATRRAAVPMLVAFLAGIVVSGVVAYMNPANADVFGFSVMWNPNVVGNMLAVGALFCSILILEGQVVVATLFLSCFMVMTIFTFSKGTWLTALLGFAACLVAMRAASSARAQRLGRPVLGARASPGCSSWWS